MAADPLKHFMRMAIGMAEKGRGRVRSNPLVGAVIVKHGHVVGRGVHVRYGGPHAEIFALRQAGRKAQGAELYVSLEPCSTWGKTGPCTEAIIQAGIKKVIVGAVDPNPRHCGRGIRKLQRAEILVRRGVLKDVVREQNAEFFTFIKKRRPYVILKMAQSLDGKVVTPHGGSRWITSRKTRRFVHGLRAKVSAIMVGTNTVRRDNPRLTVRNGRNHHRPARVLLDRRLRLSTRARVFSGRGGPVYVMTSHANIRRAQRRFGRRVEVIGIGEKGDGLNLCELMSFLAKKGISSLLVEGGGELAASLLKEKLVDKFYWCIAPKFIGGKDSKTSVEGKGVLASTHALRVKRQRVFSSGEDLIVEGVL